MIAQKFEIQYIEAGRVWASFSALAGGSGKGNGSSTVSVSGERNAVDASCRVVARGTGS